MSKSNSNAKGGGSPMTPLAASRIQSAGARASSGHVNSGSFAARAQSAAAHNASTSGPSGGKAGK